jgi:hypothetical protein
VYILAQILLSVYDFVWLVIFFNILIAHMPGFPGPTGWSTVCR